MGPVGLAPWLSPSLPNRLGLPGSVPGEGLPPPPTRVSQRVATASRGTGLPASSPSVLTAAARQHGSSQGPEFLPAPAVWPRGAGERPPAWLQRAESRPGGPSGSRAAGRGRRDCQPMPAPPGPPPLGWRGTPWPAGPPGTCKPSRSATSGQTKPLSQVPGRERGTSAFCSPCPAQESWGGRGRGGGGHTLSCPQCSAPGHTGKGPL